MYNKKQYLITLLSFILLMTNSCIKDDRDNNCFDCCSVLLKIEDRYYLNQTHFPEYKSQLTATSPFREYTHNLIYELRNIDNQASFYISPILEITHNNTEHTIELNNIPQGNYILNILGNIESDAQQGDIYNLHPHSMEHFDTYTATDTLCFPIREDAVEVGLQRTKGVLLLFLENIPDSIKKIESRISAIYEEIDDHFRYLDNVGVTKSFEIDKMATPYLQTYLAPTVANKKSRLTISLFSNNKEESFSALPDVELVIQRNEITVLKLSLNSNNQYDIYMYIEGSWEKLHQLTID